MINAIVRVREYHRCSTQKTRHYHGLPRECYQHRARDQACNTREMCVMLINSQDKVLFTNYLNHAECVDLEHENVTSFFYISHKTAIDR